jgi:hypothetical protein
VQHSTEMAAINSHLSGPSDYAAGSLDFLPENQVKLWLANGDRPGLTSSLRNLAHNDPFQSEYSTELRWRQSSTIQYFIDHRALDARLASPFGLTARAINFTTN